MKDINPRPGAHRRLAAMLRLAGLAALAACNLDVSDPEFATPESLTRPEAIPTLYAGALGDFQNAYSGGGLDDKFLSTTALITDELKSSDTFTTRNATDTREQFPSAQGNTTDAAYVWLHRARRSLKVAASAIETVIGADDPRVAELRALEGYTYVALGEAFCGAIPFSEVEGGTFIDGEPLGTAQVFDEAVSRFDAALAADASSNLAKIGKARALVNNGDYAGAAAAVAGIPTTFVYLIEHSVNSNRQQNPIYNLNISNSRYTIADVEGGTGLPFLSADDPRIPWADIGVGFDTETPLYAVLRYPDFGTDVPLATGVEARLIEAEAALAAGNTATFLQKLNNLRDSLDIIMPVLFEDWDISEAETETTNTSLAPLTLPLTTAEQEDLLFDERGFWLFMTGHRLGDFRRLIRDYGRTQAEVFPTGAWHKLGLSYGDDVAFPVPFNEENNPNYDPAQCDVDQA